MLERWAYRMVRHRWWVLSAWVLVVVVLGVLRVAAWRNEG